MKRLMILLLTASLLLGLTGCGNRERKAQYKNALELYEAGKYTAAQTAFEAADGYKDSEDYVLDCKYYIALTAVSPDSTPADGYSGNVSCTDANVSRFTQAVETLKELDGHKDSERILKAAQKALDAYTTETRTKRLVAAIESQLVGYVDRCEYDGHTFNVYFDESYPITFEVVMRGQAEDTVRDSWTEVRSWFTDTVFDYFPDCKVNIIDRDGATLGTYLYAADIDDVSVMFDIATKPY